MADYRLTRYVVERCKNGWHLWKEPPITERKSEPICTWIARTALEAGEIIGREEGEDPKQPGSDVEAQFAAGFRHQRASGRIPEDSEEQEEGRD